MIWGCVTLVLWALSIVTAIWVAAVFASFNGLWLMALMFFLAGCAAARALRREVDRLEREEADRAE